MALRDAVKSTSLIPDLTLKIWVNMNSSKTPAQITINRCMSIYVLLSATRHGTWPNRYKETSHFSSLGLDIVPKKRCNVFLQILFQLIAHCDSYTYFSRPNNCSCSMYPAFRTTAAWSAGLQASGTWNTLCLFGSNSLLIGSRFSSPNFLNTCK